MIYNRNEAARRSMSPCDKVESTSDWVEYDRENIDSMPVAMAYVPWQFMKDVYEPSDALQIGTIFPELDKPFLCYRFSGGRRA